MNPAKLLQLFTFGFLFIVFALASNENSTNPNSNISNTYCLDADTETCDVVAEMLKAKREMSDGPTIVAYIVIAAIIVIPQIPQIDV